MGPLWPSPFFAVFVPACVVSWGRFGPGQEFWTIDGYFFLAVVALVGLALRWASLLLFDRGLGRVRDRSKAAPTPVGKPKLVFEPDWSEDPAAIGPPA
jgi:hypothetical protein